MEDRQRQRHRQMPRKAVAMHVGRALANHHMGDSVLMCKVYDGIQRLFGAKHGHFRVMACAGVVKIIQRIRDCRIAKAVLSIADYRKHQQGKLMLLRNLSPALDQPFAHSLTSHAY